MFAAVVEDIEAASPPASYWSISRGPLASLAFIVPLLIVYEAGVLGLGPQAARNGADLWLRGLLDTLGFGQYFLLPSLTVVLLLTWHHLSGQPWRLPPARGAGHGTGEPGAGVRPGIAGPVAGGRLPGDRHSNS